MSGTVNVQVDSAGEVQAYFACPQDPEQWPDQKKLSTSDPEWLAYFNKMKALGETNGFDLISGMPAPTTD